MRFAFLFYGFFKVSDVNYFVRFATIILSGFHLEKSAPKIAEMISNSRGFLRSYGCS